MHKFIIRNFIQKKKNVGCAADIKATSPVLFALIMMAETFETSAATNRSPEISNSLPSSIHMYVLCQELVTELG